MSSSSNIIGEQMSKTAGSKAESHRDPSEIDRQSVSSIDSTRAATLNIAPDAVNDTFDGPQSSTAMWLGR